MCGICGFYDPDNRLPEKTALLEKMNAAQKHRGPDDEGICIEGPAGLGHVRLSILDLTAAGHQPMHYQDRYTVVYNGEIYNYIELREELMRAGYAFRTNCDTEVLLAAYDHWGEDCQTRFNGFWAFAVHDRQTGSLFLSRDRYGVKPLYYTELPGYLLFASEIKTLLADERVERTANDAVIFDYLVNGFVDCTEETFFNGIFRLEAGCCMRVYPRGGKQIRRYYELPYRESLSGPVTEETVRTFRSLFEQSIRLRLRADVPVGSCLSGGLDSSAIVCESSRQLRAVGGGNGQKTFSSCYRGDPNDERRFMDAVIEQCGVDAHFAYPTGDTLYEDLERLIYTQDEPFVSTSMYASYCVMRLAHENGAKVLLDGQGADEILCGYRKARVYYIKRLLRAGKPVRAARELLAYLPYMRRGKNVSLLADLNMIRQFLGKTSSTDIRHRYLEDSFAKRTLRNSYAENDRFLLNDFDRIVLPALLRYVDRNSMAFSIEDRLPFLDWRLVEYAMSLPLNAKIDGGWSKAIMRKALDMPEIIRRRRDKIGFYTPEKAWMDAHLPEYRAVFEAPDFRAGRYINAARILADWDSLTRGKDDIGLFRYLCLEKWMRIFDVKTA